MTIVAVSQRVDSVPDRNERRDALDQRLVHWLTASGYVAVPVPNGLVRNAHATNDDDALSAWLDAVRPHAVVLSGGNDIGSAPVRDATEHRLLQHAAVHRLPLLGICRGMQMMAYHAGTSLVGVAAHIGAEHALTWTMDTRNGECAPTVVNSFHTYAVGECPSGYRALARSADGCIEAIGHTSLPWEGWMWHPERDRDAGLQHAPRLRALFESPA